MRKQIITIISDISGYEKEQFEEDSYLVADLGFDSIMMMDLYQTIRNTVGGVNLEGFSIQKLKSDITVNELFKLLDYEVKEPSNKVISLLSDFEEIRNFSTYYKQMKEKVPYFKQNQSVAKNVISIDDKKYINYSTYNYLGLNGQSDVASSAKQAIEQYGTSVSGSRLLCGEISLHGKLEKKIASFLAVDDALVQVSGHGTNINVITTIMRKGDLILHDSLAHNSIVQGAIFSGAKRKPFKHNDMKSLEKELSMLRGKYNRVMIVVEGIYSMDGDICNLPELIKIKKKFDAILMVDEAHSFGTIGDHGRGVASYYGISSEEIDIFMGTLSKSASSCGGYIAGSQDFIDYLRYNMGGFVFSCGISPANTAAALESIKVFEKSHDLIEKLAKNSFVFLEGCKKLGIDTGLSKDTPIIPWIIGNSSKTLLAYQLLYEQGINVMPIVYPAVKENESRLRFFMSTDHTVNEINHTLNAIDIVKKRLCIENK
ncbi:aminotransferase class I/II-fold pyridoxal phosphate-dependent enzyme [Enterococcus sp. RIT-PI-f]|uniref:aminotransferase class I/II-fold pyridoxal phosphate-dependent enzyme n=1 Tax=Enterococcus sp. RIT-PI-f TaxID=1690244 RepID=UPI0006B9CF8B|nr:aminotransferase class I/II-fold pyridoxal phosphate-dependent enzyme [Enterococcus sp. RIT-PI-f]KPG69748.1 8-amino-7-oxononanoate synthase [Enterococcus sp. RIT-PI-f]